MYSDFAKDHKLMLETIATNLQIYREQKNELLGKELPLWPYVMTPEQQEEIKEIERLRASKQSERAAKAEAAKKAAEEAEAAAAKKGGKKSRGGVKSPGNKDAPNIAAGLGTPSVEGAAGGVDSLEALVVPGLNIKSTDDDPARQKEFIEF